VLYVILYIASIAGINLAFSIVGANFVTNVVAGSVFILRDCAQRAVGHRVIWAMIAATAASFVLADPVIAFASAAAFCASELIDWVVYTAMRRPWRDRMLLSSAIACPVDSALFLGLAGFWSWESVVTMTLAKWAIAAGVYGVSVVTSHWRMP
jgi:uncharacterized PurR-regulated membrane protein YhhQ (DUF165 family)